MGWKRKEANVHSICQPVVRDSNRTTDSWTTRVYLSYQWDEWDEYVHHALIGLVIIIYQIGFKLDNYLALLAFVRSDLASDVFLWQSV